VTPKGGALAPSLRYPVKWRPHLWLRPLKYALGDPARFSGWRVLDLGCRFGKMACWFAAQGAIVDGVDVSSSLLKNPEFVIPNGVCEVRNLSFLSVLTEEGFLASLGMTAMRIFQQPAREAIDVASTEQSKWRIGKDALSFRAFDGNLASLPLGEYDLVFTKSVLTVLRDRNPIQFLSSVPALLKPGGQYLAVENAAAGFPVSLVRRWLHRRWNSSGRSFHGVDDTVLAHFRDHFGAVSYRRFWGLIVAIQARKSD